MKIDLCDTTFKGHISDKCLNIISKFIKDVTPIDFYFTESTFFTKVITYDFVDMIEIYLYDKRTNMIIELLIPCSKCPDEVWWFLANNAKFSLFHDMKKIQQHIPDEIKIYIDLQM